MSTERIKAKSTIQIDNNRVTVHEWRFAKGEETGWHRHEYDYVVVPHTSGKLRLEAKEGNTEAKLVAGQPYFRNAGVEHNVVSITDTELIFYEIELKG